MPKELKKWKYNYNNIIKTSKMRDPGTNKNGGKLLERKTYM
jgi:hypothetical protein